MLSPYPNLALTIEDAIDHGGRKQLLLTVSKALLEKFNGRNIGALFSSINQRQIRRLRYDDQSLPSGGGDDLFVHNRHPLVVYLSTWGNSDDSDDLASFGKEHPPIANA